VGRTETYTYDSRGHSRRL